MTTVLESLMMSAGSVLGLVLVKASLVGVAGLVAAKLIDRASAARRAALWTAVAIGLALLPALHVLLPAIRVPLPARAVLVPSDAAKTQVTPADVTHSDRGNGGTGLGDAALGADRGEIPGTSGSGLTSKTSPEPSRRRAEAVAVAAVALALLWAVGFMANLGRMLAGVFHARRLVRRAVPLPPGHRAQALLIEVARQLGLRTRVQLQTSDDLDVPAMLGVRRPRVVLPSACLEWDEAGLRAILLHELAHVARRDYVVRVLWELIRAFYWVNPLVSRAAASARTDTERAADDRVVTAGIDPIAYAEQLLAIARGAHASQRAALALGVVSGPLSPLKLRIRAILDAAIDRRPAAALPSVAWAVSVLGFAVPVASLGVATAAQEVMLAAAVVSPARLSTRARGQLSDSVTWALTPGSSARDTVAFRLLFAADPLDRLAAARVVRVADSDEMVRDLLAVFADTVGKCSGMRWRAARGLRELHDARAVPQLVAQLVSDSNPDVRAMVANAIAAASTDEGVRLLRDALSGGTPELFGRVGRAIDTLGDTPARRALLGALRDARAKAYSGMSRRPNRARQT